MSENTRHPHYDVIVAFAEGKPIQYYSTLLKSWLTYGSRDNAPSFDHTGQYRVKPETVKYRLWIYRRAAGEEVVSVLQSGENASTVENHPHFVRWLGDWQEVEV